MGMEYIAGTDGNGMEVLRDGRESGQVLVGIKMKCV